MSLPRWLPIVAVMAVFGLLIAGPSLLPGNSPVAAQTDGEVQTVTVIGHAVAKQAPDTAMIQVGVVSRAKTAKEAREQNAQAMDRLRNGLQRAGVAAGDISTSHYSLNPVYDYGTDGREPRITGFQVEQMLEVKTKQVDQVGALIDAAVAAGANRVQGVQFGLSDPTALRNRLFDNAVQDARQKAERLASAAGLQVTRVLEIEEQFESRLPVFTRVQAEAVVADTVITPGDQEVSVSVLAVFEMR